MFDRVSPVGGHSASHGYVYWLYPKQSYSTLKFSGI